MSENKEARIIDELMHQIVSNRLEPGTRLPSENKLANKYSVPRMTVRSAFAKLEQRGYIYSKQGKGRFLKEKSRQIELHLTGKNSFTEKMKNLGHDLKTRNIYCEQIDYDAKIYHILQAEKDGNVSTLYQWRADCFTYFICE
ncbi:GntR family transcriptional regulator [Virgibacillus alimentarius]|uniref:GntR family transcriptional regulator n=1 Tax=Virgibacillus alimentarius TaxID=698769 RepID=UPI000B0A3988|nr:GntR family transcriptional regulator [Virgibacillus alimentarius]